MKDLVDQSFDDVDESSDLDAPVPEGWYDVTIKNIETDSWNGDDYIKGDFAILGPDHANRRVFHDFRINASNETARNIALSTLKSLVKSLGYGGWPDTLSELQGQETQAKVKINCYWSEASGEAKSSNQIATFRDPTEHNADGPEPSQPDWRAEMEKLKEENSGPAPSGGDSDSFDDDDIPF